MSCDKDLPPKELQDVIAARVSGPLHWVRLPGGRTNHSWRVAGQSCDWVVKLFDPGRSNALFPNDPNAERNALIALKGTALAPDFVARFDSPAGACLVYRFFVGGIATSTTPDTLQALGRLHRIPPLPGVRWVDVTPKALLAQGQAFLKDLETPLARRLNEICPKPFFVLPGKDVFLHGDPVPANVLMGPEGHRFIDWQCPARGDATADLAIALSPAMHHVYGLGNFTVRTREAALVAYPDVDAIVRYRLLLPFFTWRMAAYCAWKAAQGEEIYQKAAEAELTPRQT